MPLLKSWGNPRYSEEKMQKGVIEFLNKYQFESINSEGFKVINPVKIYSEIHIPWCGRRSDIIVQITPRKIYNIECKLTDVQGVITQAINHLKWADYSYVCMPNNVWIANGYRTQMIELGIGLLLWDPESLKPTEAIYSRHNKKKDKSIRKKVNAKLNAEVLTLF